MDLPWKYKRLKELGQWDTREPTRDIPTHYCNTYLHLGPGPRNFHIRSSCHPFVACFISEILCVKGFSQWHTGDPHHRTTGPLFLQDSSMLEAMAGWTRNLMVAKTQPQELANVEFWWFSASYLNRWLEMIPESCQFDVWMGHESWFSTMFGMARIFNAESLKGFLHETCHFWLDYCFGL